jgi:hypothetical protein
VLLNDFLFLDFLALDSAFQLSHICSTKNP